MIYNANEGLVKVIKYIIEIVRYHILVLDDLGLTNLTQL